VPPVSPVDCDGCMCTLPNLHCTLHGAVWGCSFNLSWMRSLPPYHTAMPSASSNAAVKALTIHNCKRGPPKIGNSYPCILLWGSQSLLEDFVVLYWNCFSESWVPPYICCPCPRLKLGQEPALQGLKTTLDWMPL